MAMRQAWTEIPLREGESALVWTACGNVENLGNRRIRPGDVELAYSRQPFKGALKKKSIPV
jgi:hypothetical protein